MRPRLRSIAPFLAIVLAAGGCGYGNAAGAGAAPAAGASDAAQQHLTPASRVRVGLAEWEIVTSSPRVTPGRVVMTVTNAGGTEHDLVVQGRLGTWRTEDLAPGTQRMLTVRTSPGETLHLWCAIPGHREQGMHTTLVVAQRSGR